MFFFILLIFFTWSSVVSQEACIATNVYQTRSQALNLGSGRQSPIAVERSEQGTPYPSEKGDEKDRLGEVAASPNSKFETASGIVLSVMVNHEIPHTKTHLISFYAQELLLAGLVENEACAIEYATLECEWKDYPPVFFNILSSQDQSFGYLVCSIMNDTAYLECIFVKEEYRGLGIGTKIIMQLEAYLQKKGLKTLKLYVFAHNLAALHLYTKLGYEVEEPFMHENKVIGLRLKKSFPVKPFSYLPF